MGRIRDDLMDKMWDTVHCEKHNETMPDSRFGCKWCKEEGQDTIQKFADKKGITFYEASIVLRLQEGGKI